MATSVLTVTTTKASALRGYRGAGDITVTCDGRLFSDLGWVVFEVRDGQHNDVRGVVGTFNNYATLQLMWLYRNKKPCRIHGWFDDGAMQPHKWTLDNVLFTGIWVRDMTGFVGFQATA